MFWEKKLFNFLIDRFESACKNNNANIEIFRIGLSNSIYEIENKKFFWYRSELDKSESKSYNLRRVIMIDYKSKKL